MTVSFNTQLWRWYPLYYPYFWHLQALLVGTVNAKGGRRKFSLLTVDLAAVKGSTNGRLNSSEANLIRTENSARFQVLFYNDSDSPIIYYEPGSIFSPLPELLKAKLFCGYDLILNKSSHFSVKKPSSPTPNLPYDRMCFQPASTSVLSLNCFFRAYVCLSYAFLFIYVVLPLTFEYSLPLKHLFTYEKGNFQIREKSFSCHLE